MKITVQPNPETGRFYLMVEDGRMRSMPAGPRLFKAEPHPDVKFIHQTRESAEADAEKLRAYLDKLEPRRQTKKELQKFTG